MTVSYTNQVSSRSSFGCFLNILVKWRGSVYKIIWGDLLIFLVLYAFLSFIYRFGLNEDSKLYFEKVVKYCAKYGNVIPVSFVLGFFVNIVMTRWWNQYLAIPSPDNIAILVSASIKSEIDRARIIRRTIMRYVCLCYAMTLSMISPKVKKRFPTLNHFIQAGLLKHDEKQIIEELDEDFPQYPKYWLPLAWSSNIATRARHEGLIREDIAVKTILDELNNFRAKCCLLLDYDWISIPLVYTQVVTLAVYSYFLTTLIGKQFISTHDENDIDFFFPILPVLEFFFYMGWLKVAEILINPFGEDEDDFEVVWLIDRHIQVSYLIVDKMHEKHPNLMQDQYWEKIIPLQLPHTIASKEFIQEQPNFSTKNTVIKPPEGNIIRADDGVSSTGESLQRRTSSFLRRLFLGQEITVNKGIPMDQVITEKRFIPEAMKTGTLIDSASCSTTNAQTEQNSEMEDFNRLKIVRQSQARKRFLHILEILRKKSNKSDEDIVKELFEQK